MCIHVGEYIHIYHFQNVYLCMRVLNIYYILRISCVYIPAQIMIKQLKHCFYDTYVPREAETATPSISMPEISESVEGKTCSTEGILAYEMESTTRSEGEVTSCVAGAP